MAAQPDPIIISGPITDQSPTALTRDRDVRRSLFEYVPVQKTPMTALLSGKLSKSVTTQNKFEWGAQPFNTQTGAITDIYTESTLTTPYTTGGTARGSYYYVKLPLADVNQFLPKDTIIIHNGSGAVQADVIGKVAAGASSYLTIQLMEADTSNVMAGTSIYYEVGSRSDNQLSALPDAQYQEPALYDNYTQDIMVSCELSDRVIKAKELIDPDIRKRNKKQGLVRMNRYVESMLRKGIKEGPGDRTFSGGYEYWLKTYASENIIDLQTSTTYQTGRKWRIGLLEALRGIEEKISRYNQSGEYWFLGGGLGIAAINEAIMDYGCYEISPTMTKFGVRYKQLQGMNLTWNIVQDPIFSTHANDTMKRSAYVFDDSLLEIREFRKLKYIPAGEGIDGYTYVNGEKSGWEWDLGLQMDNFGAHAYIKNIGVDNTAS